MRTSEIFSRRLKDARTRRGWKQSDLSIRVTELGHPLDRATVAKIERGERRVTLDDAVALAAALGFPLMSLLAPEGEEDVELAPALPLRTRFAQSWMMGWLPLRREDVKDYEEAASPLVSVFFLGRDLPRLLEEEALRPAEREPLRAYIAREEEAIRDTERRTLRPDTPESVLRDWEESKRKRREGLEEIKQLVPEEES
jgi:transcriptional regulator with XRE-family HTH domain